MRIGLGALLFEGNTFSPVVTGIDAFESKYLHRGAAIIEGLRGSNTEAAGAAAEAARRGASIVPLIATHGGAGGRVARDVYQQLKGELLERLKGAGSLDGLYLALHGSFVAEGVDDAEGEILTEVRAVVGDIPIVVSCDMHAHVTEAMLTAADGLIGYQLYPHDDTAETGERSMAMLLDMVESGVRPVTRAYRVPMIVPAQKQRTQGYTPMARVFARAREMERNGMRRVSYFCVQPWMDFPAMGFTAVAVADDAEAADAAAREIATMAWEARNEFLVDTLSPDDAIAAGMNVPGQVILADAADCVGGGAAGSSAEVLKSLLRAAPDADAAIHVVAPEVVEIAGACSPGDIFSVHFSDADGALFPVSVELVWAGAGSFTYKTGFLGGVTASMGPCALLRAGKVEILAASLSAYEYGDEAFRSVGIDVAAKKFVVVKNPMNYQAAYPDAAAYHVLATKGPTTPELTSLPFERIDRPIFPLDPEMALQFTSLRTRRQA